jgi:5'-nucleotidase
MNPSRTFRTALFLALAVLVVAGPASAQTDRLTIFHNNDGESQLLPTGDTGGIARYVATLDRERGLVPAGEGQVTVSSGDNFLPGPEFNASFSNGIPFFDTLAIEAIGYDALALGNHDFDFGPDTLADFFAGFTSAPQYVAANLDFAAEPGLQALVDAGTIAKSTVVSTAIGDVGIIGATTPNIRFISAPRNVVIDAVVPAIESEVLALEGAGVDKIVLISHLQGLAEEIAVVAQLRGIDAVVAGGGDELLANPGNTLLPGDVASAPYPATATDLDGNSVPVVTTSGNYRYVGRLVLEFDANGDVVGVDPSSGPVRVVGTTFADGVGPDAAAETNIEQPVQAALDALANNVIAQSEVDLDGQRNSVRFFETNQGNLVADALRWIATRQAADFGVPAPDVALQNGGGMRDDRTLPAGPITELNTFDILPFSNFVTITPNVTRPQFKEIMENCVSRALPEDGGSGTGRFAQVSGMSFLWDVTGTAQQIDPVTGAITTPGTRIVEITLDDGTPIVAGGEVVVGPDLTVTTVNFLANGGDQYPHLSDFTRLAATYQSALQDYLISADGLDGLVTAGRYPEGGEGRITRFDPVSIADGEDQVAPVRRTLALAQNTPNPFNPLTNIAFSLPKSQSVRLSIFDVKGRLVTTLVDGTLESGDHTVIWNGIDHNGRPAASGQYFYVLSTDSRRLSRSMLLVK